MDPSIISFQAPPGLTPPVPEDPVGTKTNPLNPEDKVYLYSEEQLLILQHSPLVSLPSSYTTFDISAYVYRALLSFVVFYLTLLQAQENLVF